MFHHYNYYTYFVISYCESSLKCWNVETFNNCKMIAFMPNFMLISAIITSPIRPAECGLIALDKSAVITGGNF